MDPKIELHADWTISACFEMIAELTFMKTIDSSTEEGHYRLKDSISELVDIDKSIVHGIEKLKSDIAR